MLYKKMNKCRGKVDWDKVLF